jgi:hypothetical protein
LDQRIQDGLGECQMIARPHGVKTVSFQSLDQALRGFEIGKMKHAVAIGGWLDILKAEF